MQRYQNCDSPFFEADHASGSTLLVDDHKGVVVVIEAVETRVERFQSVTILAVEDLK